MLVPAKPEARLKIQAGGRLLCIWAHTVRFPLIAFFVGMSVRESLWALAWLPLVLFIPTLGIPLSVLSIATFFFADMPAMACLLASVGVSSLVESWVHYVHASRQVNAAFTGILGPRSGVDLKELEPPDALTTEFPGFRAKIHLAQIVRRFIERTGWSDLDLAILKSGPVRVFQSIPRDAGRVVDAAMAFPQYRAASLVFVRQSFDALSDFHRFQLFHELAHGTPEGADSLLRPLRWEVLQKLSALTGVGLLIACVVSSWRGAELRGWACVAALLYGLGLRSLIAATVKRISVGASEAFADSIALMHPYFEAGEKWKERAQRQLQRLSSEMEQEGLDPQHEFAVHFRAFWLKRWLRIEKVPPYIAADVDPRLPFAFLALVAAGWYAPFGEDWLRIGYWCIAIPVLVLAVPLRGWAGAMGNRELIRLEERLSELLAHSHQQDETPMPQQET